MQNGMLKGMVNSGERTLATGGVQRALAPTHKAMSASWWPQHWASGEDLHYPQTFGQLLIQSAKEAAAIARGELSPDVVRVKERLHDRYYSGYHDEAFDEALRVIEQMEAVRRQDLRDFNRLQGDLSRAQARCEELERSAEGYRASYLIAHGERAEAHATIERLTAALERVGKISNTDPWRTFDAMIQDMQLIDDIARSALGRGE
jgi:hypothetical protein